MVFTLVHRCFQICSKWTKLNTELLFLEQIFLKNGYPENTVKITLTIEKKPLVLVLLYLSSISKQTKTKLKRL